MSNEQENRPKVDRLAERIAQVRIAYDLEVIDDDQGPFLSRLDAIAIADAVRRYLEPQ